MVDFRDWTGPMTWIGFKRLLVSGETFLILFGGVCTFAARAGAGMHARVSYGLLDAVLPDG